jgi:hypothetical protein
MTGILRSAVLRHHTGNENCGVVEQGNPAMLRRTSAARSVRNCGPVFSRASQTILQRSSCHIVDKGSCGGASLCRDKARPKQGPLADPGSSFRIAFFQLKLLAQRRADIQKTQRRGIEGSW